MLKFLKTIDFKNKKIIYHFLENYLYKKKLRIVESELFYKNKMTIFIKKYMFFKTRKTLW